MKLENNFSNIEAFETEIKNRGFFHLWDKFQDGGADGFSYQELEEWENIFKPFGLTFDYGLSAEVFDFELKNL